MQGELLEFPGEVYGMVLNLEEDNVGAVLLGDSSNISEGDTVKTTGRVVEVPVGMVKGFYNWTAPNITRCTYTIAKKMCIRDRPDSAQQVPGPGTSGDGTRGSQMCIRDRHRIPQHRFPLTPSGIPARRMKAFNFPC